MDQVIVGVIVGGLLTTITTVVTEVLRAKNEREKIKLQRVLEGDRWHREIEQKRVSELEGDFSDCLYHLTAFFDGVTDMGGQPHPNGLSDEAKGHRRGAQKCLMRLLPHIGDIDSKLKEAVRVFLEFSDDWSNARYIRDRMLELAKARSTATCAMWGSSTTGQDR